MIWLHDSRVAGHTQWWWFLPLVWLETRVCFWKCAGASTGWPTLSLAVEPQRCGSPQRDILSLFIVFLHLVEVHWLWEKQQHNSQVQLRVSILSGSSLISGVKQSKYRLLDYRSTANFLLCQMEKMVGFNCTGCSSLESIWQVTGSVCIDTTRCGRSSAAGSTLWDNKGQSVSKVNKANITFSVLGK